MKKPTKNRDVRVNIYYCNEGQTLQKIMESNLKALVAKNPLLNK